MALGILLILYVVIITCALIIQVSLYKSKNTSSTLLFIINLLFSLFLSYLAFTSLPTNYTGQRTVIVLFAVLSIVAVLLNVWNNKFALASKVMLSIAIIVNLLYFVL